MTAAHSRDIPALISAHFAIHPLAIVACKRGRGKTTALAKQLVDDLLTKTPPPPAIYILARTLESTRAALHTALTLAAKAGLTVESANVRRALIRVSGALVPVETHSTSTLRGIASKPWIYVDEVFFVPPGELADAVAPSQPSLLRCIGSPESMIQVSTELRLSSEACNSAQFDAHIRARYPWALKFPLLIVAL